MNKKPVLLITVAIFVSATLEAALACGPVSSPRYSRVIYFDPIGSDSVNFSAVLEDFTIAAERDYLSERTLKAQHTQSFDALLTESGRAIYRYGSYEGYRDTFCPGNTDAASKTFHDTIHEMREQKFQQIKSEWNTYRKYYDLWPSLLTITAHTRSRCSPNFGEDYVQYDNLAHINGLKAVQQQIAAVESAEFPAEWIQWRDFRALALARYYAYIWEFDRALSFLREMSPSPAPPLTTFAADLKRDIEVMRSMELPVMVSFTFKQPYVYGACFTNHSDNAMLFARHVLNSEATDKQAAALIEARNQLVESGCGESVADLILDPNQFESPEVADFARYITAAASFYSGNYPTARQEFAALKHATNQWVAETAHYVEARAALISAQVEWNGYTEPPEGVDATLVRDAGNLYREYLERYPNGQYAQSARGMLRRVAFLSGNMGELNRLLSVAIHTAGEALLAERNAQTSEHFKNVLTEWKRYSDRRVDYAAAPPIMIAFDVLRQTEDPAGKLVQLRETEGRFASGKDLFRLLEETLLFKAGQYEAIPLSDVKFETNVDVGLAVIQAKRRFLAGDYEGSRKIWTALHLSSDKRKGWDQLQLEIAQTYIAEQDYKGMARADSHVEHAEIFEDAFAAACDSNTLVQIANDKASLPVAARAARNEAFRRPLLHGNFAALHAMYERIDDIGDFALIRTAARKTASDPDDANGLLNLGYFMLAKMERPITEITAELVPPGTDLQCGDRYVGRDYLGPRHFLGKVVELHSDGKRSVDEAKALHYLVNCERTGNNARECYWGRAGLQIPEGKELFKRLHSKYPKSKWSERTPYYYD